MLQLSFKAIGLVVLEKVFLKCFPIYGHGGILGLAICTKYINIFPLDREAAYEIYAVSEEKSFKNVDDGLWMDDEGYHPISSPAALVVGELKSYLFDNSKYTQQQKKRENLLLLS